MNQPLEAPASPPPLTQELPFDFHPVPGRERSLRSHTFPLVHRGAQSGGRRRANVPDSLLTASFAILLARYSGQPGIVLELNGLTGYGERAFAQTVRMEIDGAATCRDVLSEIPKLLQERSSIGAGDARHADAGGRAALSWLEADHDEERERAEDLDAVTASIESCLENGCDADLTLVIGPGGDDWATFVFDSSLFKRSSVERFAGHLNVILAQLTTSLDARVCELPLLMPSERRWLESMCDGVARSRSESLVHELIERRAALTPAAVAVRFREQSLSYAELNRRANRLAQHLIDRGIGAGSRVIVCVDPALDIIVALLGILKAGAAYVPLDPTYPPARMQTILEDTSPELIISQSHLEQKLVFDRCAVLVLDTLLADADAPAPENPGLCILPDQLAYVYYTSGTTGTPKGVMGEHANLLHYVHSAAERYRLDNGDVMPALARFSFSISMFELLTPLVVGGTLVILEREHILDPARMSRTLAEVTAFHAGPSLLKGLIAYIRRHHASFEEFSRVRHASSGGDMVPPELLEAMKEVFPRAEVFVIYGCSEISCMGCTYPVPRERAITTTYVGRPFDNVLLRVLNPGGRVLPAGIVGEVYFAGDGITKGYLNRPELTAEKFITLEGRRFYRTGDRGRLSEDGFLELLGRNDFQTKLRGMRVELGEVEHELRRAPGVREAVAVARETVGEEKVLVAYLVTERANDAQTEKAARIAAVRQYVSEHLPDYMVPAVYVELDALPLNHNLKVDRRALPPPAASDLRAVSASRVREPQTPNERLLASLWQKLLGVQQVGLDDNFFELGGHSMLAVLFSLELEEALGFALEGMDILREPLQVLATICDRRQGHPSQNPAAEPRASTPVPLDPVEVFHFGPGQSLYGVLHGRASAARSAALICGPVGQEHVRARFVLSRLAKQLARAGIPTLLFDYFGCGDSLGDSGEADFARWRRDIKDAHAELARRTNGVPISAIGVRLGGSLLCQVSTQLDLEKVVLWDPVCDGHAHSSELAALQRRYHRSIAQLKLYRWPRRPARARGTELLGTTYSSSALRELRTLQLMPYLAQTKVPICVLSSLERAAERPDFAGASGAPQRRVELVDFNFGWSELARLEDVIPDVRISARLAAMVSEAP